MIAYVSQKSERTVKIGKLDVEFTGLINPTVKFEDLYISNATWSDKRPLISAEKISFKFNAIQFLLHPNARTVHVTMSASEVNLERLNDGLRNWRLLKPNYKGVGRYLVLSLRANNSVINFNNHALHLNLSTKFSPNLNSISLPNKIIFIGSYFKAPFDGVVLTGPKVTFQQTNEFFNVSGFVNQGKNKIKLVGKVGDVYRNSLIDAEINLTGNMFSLVNFLSNQSLSGQNTVTLTTYLHKLKNNYEFNKFSGEMNGSDLKGELSYVHDTDVPQAVANFTSKVADLKNIADTFTQLQKTEPTQGRQLLFTDHLKKMHLNLMLKIQNVVNIKHMDIRNLKIAVIGSNGEFDTNIETDQFNAGKFSGNFAIRPGQDRSTVQIEIIVKKMKLANLLNDSELDNKVAAPVDIKVNGSSVGNSFPDFISNVSGKAYVTLGKGMISNKLDAKLGLDFGKIFWLSFRGDKSIALNCGKLIYTIKNGVASSSLFFIDTEQTTINGQSDFDLSNKRLNVFLDPTPKNPTLFAKNESLKLTGHPDGAHYKLKATTTKSTKPIAKILHSCDDN